MHQAEAKALAPGRERALQCAEAAVRPEVPYFAADAERDVQRTFAKFLARSMRDIRSRRLSLASCAFARTTPLAKRQFLLSVLHSAIVARGSDIASRNPTSDPGRCLPFQEGRARAMPVRDPRANLIERTSSFASRLEEAWVCAIGWA